MSHGIAAVFGGTYINKSGLGFACGSFVFFIAASAGQKCAACQHGNKGTSKEFFHCLTSVRNFIF